MSVSLPSDEVGEDYKNSLEDLVSNDRYQISNLTLIAKENIEHAEAISRVLQNHIQRVPPARKLPALYVLDSIVKNVGSPYTVYFGRNLYQTFMHAYSQVDSNVKRKLEEMLKTWREPVPGALSTVPVFPLASTQNIVDNLKKLRSTSALPTPRFQSSIRSASTQPFRNTPTPPQSHIQTPLGIQSHNGMTSTQNQNLVQDSSHQYTDRVSSGFSQNSQLQPEPQYQSNLTQSTPTISDFQQSSSTPQPPAGSVDVIKLHLDIDDLTTDAKIECATHPMDANAQRKLATFQTLKEILDSGNASEIDLVDIRNSIMQEMAKKLAIRHHTPTSSQGKVASLPVPFVQQTSKVQTSATPSFLNSTNLAELLRATANQAQNLQPGYVSTYTQHQHIPNTPPILNATPIPQAAGEIPLLAQLRASGLLSATLTPSGTKTPNSTFPINTIENDGLEIKLTSISIRVPRPQFITNFLNLRPNQCSTCGRRFTSDDIGREKKARHLDWHFKTKARMIEAEQRGQNRSWYVGEREWISSREYEDDASPFNANGSSNVGASPSNPKKIQNFVQAPTDPVLRSLPCPIDQEPFRSEWNEDVQDFIWKDAIQVGGRYYHASCYNEVIKARSTENDNTTLDTSASGRTATPDSILGKRKAEDGGNEIKSKMKLEG